MIGFYLIICRLSTCCCVSVSMSCVAHCAVGDLDEYWPTSAIMSSNNCVLGLVFDLC